MFLEVEFQVLSPVFEMFGLEKNSIEVERKIKICMEVEFHW